MIVVVDYGMGNIGSIVNMIKKVGGRAEVARGPDDLRRADKLILPGVGAFDHGMAGLHRLGYVDVLNERVLEARTPILGICLGIQLFTRRSEEGERPGLGWIEADTVRFRFPDARPALKVPHMGWSPIRVVRPHPLFADPEAERRFYFVHTYHVVCDAPADVLATATYGTEFTAAVARGNVIGTQFHPEKSHRFGKDLMRHFVEDVSPAGEGP